MVEFEIFTEKYKSYKPFFFQYLILHLDLWIIKILFAPGRMLPLRAGRPLIAEPFW